MSEAYSKAPIMEATINLGVSSEGMTLESIVAFKEQLQSTFPEQDELFRASAEIRLTPPYANTVTGEHIGYRLADKNRVLQITTQGFTFSYLFPYEEWKDMRYGTWQAFRDDAKHFWQGYKVACHVSIVNRVGVRYINRLDVPATQKLNAYLLLHPSVPQYPCRDLAGFFMQLQIPQPDIQSMLIINEVQVEPPNADTISLIIDLDLFRSAMWSVQDDTSLWAFLETLRIRKDEIFEASITQKTREIIK